MAPSLSNAFKQPSWSYQTPETDTRFHSFDLADRVYQAAVYPVLSEDGHRLFIHAHQKGIGITWHGGHEKKIPQPPKLDDKRRQDKDAMDIERHGNAKHDEDESFQTQPDPSSASVVDSLDILLPTAAIDLSFPHLPRHAADHPARSLPAVFRQRAVVSVLCADGSVRIIAFPLQPPGDGRRADLCERVEDGKVQCYLVSGLAPGTNGKAAGVRSSIIARQATERSADAAPQGWEFVLASWTRSPFATLSITRIPLQSAPELFGSLQKTAESQSRTMSLPHAIVSLAFNTARPNSARCSRFVFSEKSGNVRIATLKPTVEGSASLPIEWLGTFQLPFSHGSSPQMLAQRERCKTLDLKWVLAGKAVLALLNDGQWGIWDLEGAGPLNPDDAERASLHSIAGGGMVPFTIHGFLNPTRDAAPNLSTQLSLRSRPRGPAQDARKLAPMTPNTRKVREQRLFSSQGRPPAKPTGRATFPTGGVTVVEVDGPENKATHESIVFWYGSGVFLMTDLVRHWQRAASATSAKNTSRNVHAGDVEAVPISSVGLGGVIRGVSQLPREKRSFFATPSDTFDLVIALENRITVISQDCSPTDKPDEARLFFQEAPRNPAAGEFRQGDVDLDMLRRGELDLGGMNRLLDGMSTEELLDSGSIAPRARRVGFAA